MVFLVCRRIALTTGIIGPETTAIPPNLGGAAIVGDKLSFEINGGEHVGAYGPDEYPRGVKAVSMLDFELMPFKALSQSGLGIGLANIDRLVMIVISCDLWKNLRNRI